jgi:hypothetical protein
MPLIIPPALKFPLPIIKPLRTPVEIHEATGKAVGWKTSEFRLVYKGYELREFSKALASGMTQRAALKHALNATRLKQVGGQMNQTIEAAKLAALPEVGRAVAKYKDKFRRRHLMDMIERRGVCAVVARRESSKDSDRLTAVQLDAKLAGELDERPELSVNFQQVLQNIQAAGGGAMLPAAPSVGGGMMLPAPEAVSNVRIEQEQAVEVLASDPLGERRVVAEIEMDEEEDGPEGSHESAVFGEIDDE